ncbi:hypothetical protein NDU88_000911 [Pleurodeles waltl]|uniref:Uncharacterized protein n=1 Tax=Pleurodeles waltl TaxID=8319 RepID=A0AAV7VVF1_PLEWA|nr:hypothetical protein NDU88_000911 [Pleurodeles waltl]
MLFYAVYCSQLSGRKTSIRSWHQLGMNKKKFLTAQQRRSLTGAQQIPQPPVFGAATPNATGSLQENKVEETEGNDAETELKKVGHDGKESLVGSGLVRRQCYENVVMNS